MKVRTFYPRQVLRRLVGDHAELTGATQAALRFLALNSRKMGLCVLVGPAEAYPNGGGQANSECGLIRVQIFGARDGFAGFPPLAAASTGD